MNRVTLHELTSGLLLKRMMLGLIWVFCLVTGIFNCITSAQKILETGEVNQLFPFGIGVIFCLIPYWTRQTAYQHIILTFQCFPNLNRYLTVADQKRLLPDSEVFHPIEELQPLYRKFTKWDRMESEHWLRIKGYFISKELLIGVNMIHSRGNLKPYRKSTSLQFIYANGEIFDIRLEDELHRDEKLNYRHYFAKYCGTTSFLDTRELLDGIHKTSCKFLDDYTAQNGYPTRQEAIVAITKGGSGLKEHIKAKYSHFWEKEESVISKYETR